MSDTGKPLGIGIVGAGMGSKPHFAALAELTDKARIQGVHLRSDAGRDKFTAQHGIEATGDLDALLGDDGIAAVLVLTPPNARLDIARRCADAGRHILMEKPLERTLAAARQIVELCAARPVTLGVVLQHRLRADVQALRRLLDEGRLGRLAAARLELPWWRPQSYYDVAGRGSFERDGGGVLLSQAIHILDVLIHLCGMPVSVAATASTTALHQMETEDFVSAGIQLPCGATGAIMATTAAYPGHAETLTLDCEHASAQLRENVLTVSWHDGRTETAGSPHATGAGADPMAYGHQLHAALLSDFIDSVAAGRSPAVTGESALAVQRLIEAIIDSAGSGQRIFLS